VIEFQTTDAYSILERTRVLYKTKRLSRVEKEDVMYRIKPSIFKPCEKKYVVNMLVKIKLAVQQNRDL
jgi:hypothetical protein